MVCYDVVFKPITWLGPSETYFIKQITENYDLALLIARKRYEIGRISITDLSP